MGKVVLAGGSGFIGHELITLFTHLGDEVVVLSRHPQDLGNARCVVWDAENVGDWAKDLEGARAVINLSGSPIQVKWTKESRLEILQSRLRSAQAIGRAIQKCVQPPEAWINASAIGYYGDRGGEELTEASAPGKRKDFVVDTCVAWEAAPSEFDTPNTRKCIVRIGIVLGKGGGAFPPYLKLTRCFLGGHHGGGEQYVSWIHVKDLARIIAQCAERDLGPVVNGTSPNPVTNRFFMAALRGVVGRPWSPPVPGFILAIANLFGAPDPSLILNGQRVLPKAARDAKFVFEYDDLRDAFRSLIG